MNILVIVKILCLICGNLFLPLTYSTSNHKGNNFFRAWNWPIDSRERLIHRRAQNYGPDARELTVL